ncbi:hypothetical protein [Nitrososphaera viennensis]|nr:hypothetical protein [Nitrososphaera viennensis]
MMIPFRLRAAAALGISVVADVLDYVAAPLFATPLIGDVTDAFVSMVLYSITKSKKAAVINALEFIPVIGDFIPVYTLSTLIWIYEETTKRRQAAAAAVREKKVPAQHIDATRPAGSKVKGETDLKALASRRYARWKRI